VIRRCARALAALVLAIAFVPALPAASANAWTVPGVLRIGVYRDVDSLSPMLSGQAAASDIAQFVFSGLVRYDDRGNEIPDAATAVPTLANGGISRDGLTIVYHLRRDVTFSDGVPLTADDVAFTWKTLLDPRLNAPYHYPNDQARSVVAKDRYTVVVRLKSRSAPFIADFMRCGIQSAILPKHVLDHESDLNHAAWNAKPVGSGPFVVKSWEPGSELVLEANPHYFRGAPKLREIRYRIIPNANSLLLAMRSHEIDYYYDAPEQQASILAALPGNDVRKTPTQSFEHVAFNCRTGPFADVRLRRAAAYAIDWAALARNVYLGVDTPGMTDIAPSSWAYDAAIRPYPHDLARARALVKAAGYTIGADGMATRNGQPLAVDIATVAGATTRENAEIQIQQNLRDIGIAVTVRNAPANLLFAAAPAGGIINSGKFDLAVYAWSKYPDPDDAETIAPDRIPPNGANATFLADPTIGAALVRAESTYDRAQRKAAYAIVQQRIHDLVPLHTIVWKTTVSTVNRDFHGFKPGPIGSECWNAWEWSVQ
jgi:peptide/nickel transport system substrate-binding protein